MNRKTLSVLTLAIAALAGSALAANAAEGKARAQVQAELQEAQRTGDIYVNVGNEHVKVNDVNSLSFN